MQIADFPVFRAALDGSRTSKTETALSILTNAVAQGAIANVDYKDNVKFPLSRAFDDAWTAAIMRPYVYGRPDVDGYRMSVEEGALEQRLGSHPQFHTLNRMLTRATESGLSTPYAKAVIAFLTEIKPIADAVVGLADKVVKRQPKAPEDKREKYLAPVAPDSAKAKVRAVLTEMTAASFDEFVDRLYNHLDAKVEAFLAASAAGKLDPYHSGRMVHATVSDHFGYKVWKDERGIRRERHADTMGADAARAATEQASAYVPAARRENGEANLRALCTGIANEMRESFILKNVEKLDSLFDRKPDLASTEILGRRVDFDRMEGSIRFVFEDGAHFRIVLQVVSTVSPKGLPFYRWPLTFHDAVLGDGTRLTRISEKKMNEEFVCANAKAA